MITAFEYESPLIKAIKAQFIALIDDYENEEGETPYAGLSERILFVDYEMSALEISSASDSDYDGVVMSYFSSTTYPSSRYSQTENADGDNTLTVICVGFGDVSETDTFGDNSGTKVATNRAQQLCSVVFKAIINRTELQLSYNDYRDEDIDEAKKLKERYITSVTKGEIVGAETSSRAIAVYEQTYMIRLIDIAPTEPLGEAYTGSDGVIETEEIN